MKPIEIEEKVMFYDTDCGGVVSNISYLRYVEKARTALFDSLGMPVETMSESQLFPVVARTEIDYLCPAKLGDAILVRAEVAEVEKVRVHCAFEILSGAQKDVCFARAKQAVVLVQMPSGRPRRVPAEWIS